jgi:hypothetical protein
MFLVETYVPRLDEERAAAISARYDHAVRELAGEGVAIRSLQSYAVFEDETYLFIVAARDADDVVVLHDRAKLAPDHVAQVVSVDAALARE